MFAVDFKKRGIGGYFFKSVFFVEMDRACVITSDLEVNDIKGITFCKFNDLAQKHSADPSVPTSLCYRYGHLSPVIHATRETVKTCGADDHAVFFGYEHDAVNRIFDAFYIFSFLFNGKRKAFLTKCKVVCFTADLF